MAGPEAPRLRHYRPGDMAAVRARPDFARERRIEPEVAGAADADWTWSLIAPDGEVLGVGGFVDQGQGRGAVWLYAAALRRRDWLRLIRTFETLRPARLRRIEAMVRMDGPAWTSAVAYARRCGFAVEGILRAYGADGTDYALLAFVVEGEGWQ